MEAVRQRTHEIELHRIADTLLHATQPCARLKTANGFLIASCTGT